jgi:hypothetical protein
MSLQSEFSDSVYQRVKLGWVSLASLVDETRARWGAGHSIESVHHFVIEAIYLLLIHQDVDVGDIANGQFIPWVTGPLVAYVQIESKVMQVGTAFEDHDSIVFRIKSPNDNQAMATHDSTTYTWIVLCLGERPATLEMIVASGDVVNHAILGIDELRAGLGWLRARGFVEKTEQGYVLTLLGLSLRAAGSMNWATVLERRGEIENRIKMDDGLGERYTELISEAEYEQATDWLKPR